MITSGIGDAYPFRGPGLTLTICGGFVPFHSFGCFCLVFRIFSSSLVLLCTVLTMYKHTIWEHPALVCSLSQESSGRIALGFENLRSRSRRRTVSYPLYRHSYPPLCRHCTAAPPHSYQLPTHRKTQWSSTMKGHDLEQDYNLKVWAPKFSLNVIFITKCNNF